MSLKSKPEDIEYRHRLKWGSVFQYTTKEHSRKDVVSDNYFHNISTRYLQPGDEINIAVLHMDGSWSKGVFEVISIDAADTVVEQVDKWRSAGGERADKPKTATKAA